MRKQRSEYKLGESVKGHRLKFVLKSMIIISIILKFIMYKMCDRGEYIFIWSRWFPHFVLSLLIIISTFLCIMIAANKKWIRAITTIALIIIIPIYMFISFIIGGGGTCFQFESPNGDNTLVIEEDGFLMHGWFNFYKKDGIKIKRIGGRASIDDGYAPLSNGDYELQWIDENTVKFKYKFNRKRNESVTIKFNERE